YTWTTSTSGTRLTLTLAEDSCAARRAAVPGDWQRVACKNTDSACFGDLIEAGTYPSQYFSPRLAAGRTWQPDWGALTDTAPAGREKSDDRATRVILSAY